MSYKAPMCKLDFILRIITKFVEKTRRSVTTLQRTLLYLDQTKNARVVINMKQFFIRLILVGVILWWCVSHCFIEKTILIFRFKNNFTDLIRLWFMFAYIVDLLLKNSNMRQFGLTRDCKTSCVHQLLLDFGLNDPLDVTTLSLLCWKTGFSSDTSHLCRKWIYQPLNHMLASFLYIKQRAYQNTWISLFHIRCTFWNILKLFQLFVYNNPYGIAL